jgi:predicted nucleic acid-binding protein
MIVVADSSPLIAMGRIGQLEILHAVFGQLLLPDAVWREVVEGAADKPGSSDVASASWIERRTVNDLAWVNLLKHDLGAGEAEAIILAKETGADFILMDERLGRSAAERLGLKVVGLIGALIEARKQGLITNANAGAMMERLSNEAGFWISEELRQLVIKHP